GVFRTETSPPWAAGAMSRSENQRPPSDGWYARVLGHALGDRPRSHGPPTTKRTVVLGGEHFGGVVCACVVFTRERAGGSDRATSRCRGWWFRVVVWRGHGGIRRRVLALRPKRP